jgi:hypothetical protein
MQKTWVTHPDGRRVEIKLLVDDRSVAEVMDEIFDPGTAGQTWSGATSSARTARPEPEKSAVEPAGDCGPGRPR